MYDVHNTQNTEVSSVQVSAHTVVVNGWANPILDKSNHSSHLHNHYLFSCIV